MAKTIAEKNDEMRRTFRNCKVITTRGVYNLELPQYAAVIEAVRSFDDFNDDNNPHGEHDFGSVVVDNVTYFWKFDYYNDDYMTFKEDGNRILTIMHADEYSGGK